MKRTQVEILVEMANWHELCHKLIPVIETLLESQPSLNPEWSTTVLGGSLWAAVVRATLNLRWLGHGVCKFKQEHCEMQALPCHKR